MGGQVISFSRAFTREKDFRRVDRVERQIKERRQQSLNSQKERLMNDFESLIQREDYFPNFLPEDIWQLYLETVENFGKNEAVKAIQKAKNRFSGRRETRKLIRQAEIYVNKFHDFRESYIISGVASRQTALDFLILCHDCGAKKIVMTEAINFLYQKKDFLILEICRSFFATFFNFFEMDFVSVNPTTSEKAWEAFQDNCLNGSAEELALKFMVLGAADPEKSFKAIGLLKGLKKDNLADICEKAIGAIRKSAFRNRQD